VSNLNRGIMKFKGADSPKAIALSGAFLLGTITLLLVWSLKVAYG